MCFVHRHHGYARVMTEAGMIRLLAVSRMLLEAIDDLGDDGIPVSDEFVAELLALVLVAEDRLEAWTGRHLNPVEPARR